MEDFEIVELYWARNERAITETGQKYGAYCYGLAYNILKNKEDAEECVNDTWMRLWNAIPPAKPMKLGMFLAKIVRNLAFNRYREKNAAKRGGGELPLVLEELSECAVGEDGAERSFFDGELSRSVNEFVRSLPERDANVFIRRYFYCESPAVIGKRYGMTENYVTVLLYRTRQKLKNTLIEEGWMEK